MKCTNSTLHAVYQKTQLSCYYAPLWSDGYDVGGGGGNGGEKMSGVFSWELEPQHL